MIRKALYSILFQNITVFYLCFRVMGILKTNTRVIHETNINDRFLLSFPLGSLVFDWLFFNYVILSCTVLL